MMPETPPAPTPTPTGTTTVVTPAQPNLWLIAAAASLGGGLFCVFVMGAALLLYEHEKNKPVPEPADPAFIALGKVYGPTIPKLYAGAWRDGKKVLKNGQPYSTAVATVKKSWDSARSTAFEGSVTPALAKIVPESTKDSDVSAAQTAAAIEAFEGLAQGLEQ